MEPRPYIAFTGGIGGAKLSLGLARILGPDELAFVVNTGDDFRHLGLHVSPDIDTLVYTLAGESNEETGWGRRDETWQFMEALEGLGGETWFRLGDRDLAMNVERTRRLASGQSLCGVTSALAAALGVEHRVLPMSDDPVTTRVKTGEGLLDFQHYFVREQCRPAVSGVVYAGAESARLLPGVVESLAAGELRGVVFCPSNPFLSVDPILALPGLRERLRDCAAPVIAVSPVVGGRAIKGPTVKMMQELGVPNSAAWVADHYADFLDGFVLDVEDEGLAPEIAASGLEVAVTRTVMRTLEDRVALAGDCVEFIDRLAAASTS